MMSNSEFCGTFSTVSAKCQHNVSWWAIRTACSEKSTTRHFVASFGDPTARVNDARSASWLSSASRG
jgi:hypothetical protein